MARTRSGMFVARAATAVLAVVVLGSVATLAALAYYRATGHELIAVRGASMGDAMPLGSLAVAERVAAERVSVGDVVLVVHRPAGGPARTPFLHRVTALEREGASTVVTTKGDANTRAEQAPYVLPPVVLRVRHAIPYAGFTASVAATPWARMATLALLVVIVATGLLRRILRAGPDAPHTAAPSR